MQDIFSLVFCFYKIYSSTLSKRIKLPLSNFQIFSFQNAGGRVRVSASMCAHIKGLLTLLKYAREHWPTYYMRLLSGGCDCYMLSSGHDFFVFCIELL